MKKTMALWLLIFSFMSASFADGGHTGTGGGLSEINIVESWKTLSLSLKKIQNSEESFTQEEHAFIEELVANQEREPEFLNFKSNKTHPGYFSEGQVFKTQSEIGSEIDLNLDLLVVVENNQERSLNSEESFIFLIHVLKTRYEVSFDFKVFVEKLMSVLRQTSLRVDLRSYNRPDIGLEFLGLNVTKIYLTGENSKVDLNDKIFLELYCPRGKASPNYQIKNLYHHSLSNFDPVSQQVRISFVGEIFYACGEEKLRGEFEVAGLYDLKGKGINVFWYLDPEVEANIQFQNVDVKVRNIDFVENSSRGI